MENKIKPINYVQSYVAFLDVLGFKELVYGKKAEDKEKLEKYFHHIEEFIIYLKTTPIKSDLDIGYIVISDSIIITVKHCQSNDENIKILRHLCIAIAFLQSLLSVLDIWLRGGISSGETYFDEKNHQIIGKAYIEAYLLEEKLVSNPHVVLDNKIINELGFKNSDELIDKINDIHRLDDNWNGFGADKFSYNIIHKSLDLVNYIPECACVYPVADDSIQFEWNIANVYYEIQVYDNKYITYIQWHNSDTEMVFVYESELHEYINTHMKG